MSRPTLKQRIESAVESGTAFGPSDPDQPKEQIPADTLRAAILDHPQGQADPGRLWMRNSRITGALDLETCDIKLHLKFEHCEFEGPVNLRQASAADIELIDCAIDERLSLDQFEARWNLLLDRTVAGKGISLTGATIGGQLSLIGATLKGEQIPERAALAFAADRMKVVGSVVCNKLQATGEVRLAGAQIGGQLSMNGADLKSDKDSPVTARSLSADRIEVAGGIFANKLSTTGEVRLLGARIGGQVSLIEATLKGVENSDGVSTAFNADRINVASNLVCTGIATTGEMRLLGAKIGGQLSMNGATLRGAKGIDGTVTALGADGVEVSGNMICGKGFSSVGEVRLLGARVGSQLSMRGATLEGPRRKAGAGKALNADRLEVARSMHCQGAKITGEARMLGAKVGGQLSLTGTTLRHGTGSAINLSGATLDGLNLAFVEVTGVVDLRQTKIRSLWDAENGKFAGQHPAELRLEGLTYQSLREPLDADHRLEWIKPSQRDRYYPSVYVELANSFRRIGHSADARAVAIASERRARKELPRWSPRRAWHDLLWITIGYGYKSWLALFWLFGLLVAGSVAFWLGESSFVELQLHAPPFDPVLYAVDATIPVLDIGQQKGWAPTGSLAWLSMLLSVSGYALATAVIAAATGLLNRGER